MDLEDSDFEPGADRELLGLFFPEVSIGKMACCVKHCVIQSTRKDCVWRGDWVSGLTVHCYMIQKVSHQVPVVQRADNFIQRIGGYPANKMYWLEYILSGG